MRSLASAGRGSPAKVLSLRPGLPDLIWVSGLAMFKKLLASFFRFGPSERLGAAFGPDALGAAVLVALDQRVRGMIMDGLEILALDHVRLHALVAVQPHGDVAHHVLDELGIVIGALGHVLLVRPLENAPQLARGFALGDIDEFLDPHVLAQPHPDAHVRALVVGAAIGNLLRAWAQAGDRHHDLDAHAGLAMVDLADQRGVVVHEALDAGHRRALHDEIGKRHLDMTGIGIEPQGHFAEHLLKRVDRNLTLAMQDLDEARHVRALEVMRQVHIHVEGRDRVLLAGGTILDLDRMTNVLDADPIDRNAAGVGARLHVLDRNDVGAPRAYDSAHGILAVANLVAARLGFKAGTPMRQRSIAAAMLTLSSPAAAMHSSRLPCSVIRSGMPMCRCGSVRPSAATSSTQALPAPPAMTLSSRVTNATWLPAISRNSCRSSGLTNLILTTVASKRSPSHSTGASMTPNDSSARPLLPRRRISARPISSADISLAMAVPGPVPRG